MARLYATSDIEKYKRFITDLLQFSGVRRHAADIFEKIEKEEENCSWWAHELMLDGESEVMGGRRRYLKDAFNRHAAGKKISEETKQTVHSALLTEAQFWPSAPQHR